MRRPESPQDRFAFFTRAKLLLLAGALAGLWYLASPNMLTSEEQQLWETVHAAQEHLSQLREQNGTVSAEQDDPWNCGLIGLEWSSLTTTLGELASKRTACNPAWAVQFSRWFQQLDLKPGDPIAIYSSGSFPGLLLNSLVAAEALALEPQLIVSLGASTWGANHPDLPWPVIGSELRRNGFIHQRADYYTLGGGAELGHGLSPEAETLLRGAAQDAGVELLTADDLGEMILLKTTLMKDHGSRLLINIGGSQANLGDAIEMLKLSPGLLPPGEKDLAGNGVIGAAMADNISVIHMLNLKSLSNTVGIPYDSKPRKAAPTKTNIGTSLLGLLIFFIVILRHQRWRLESVDK